MPDESQAFALPGATEAATVARSPWTTYFVDVSNNNGSVDWRRLAHSSRSSGITGAIMKATEGTSFVDHLFAGARATAEHWGIRVGAYHFARPDQNPGVAGAIAEAKHFARVLGMVGAGEWRPMLDLETAPFQAEWVKAWNAEVRKLTGVAPLLYSYFSALHDMRLREPLGAGLVIAYPNGLPRAAPAPPPWQHWTAHQYSWHGHAAGVPGQVDLNWTPAVRTMLAFPVKGAALEPVYARRRRSA